MAIRAVLVREIGVRVPAPQPPGPRSAGGATSTPLKRQGDGTLARVDHGDRHRHGLPHLGHQVGIGVGLDLEQDRIIDPPDRVQAADPAEAPDRGLRECGQSQFRNRRNHYLGRRISTLPLPGSLVRFRTAGTGAGPAGNDLGEAGNPDRQRLDLPFELRDRLDQAVQLSGINDGPGGGVGGLSRTGGVARLSGPACAVGSGAHTDLDDFEAFNDSHGHPEGDRLLRDTVEAWKYLLRTEDHLARYGGDEFMLTLPDTDVERAGMATERLRAAVPRGQTCSAGVACIEPGDSLEQLVKRADEALYREKSRRIPEKREKTVPE